MSRRDKEKRKRRAALLVVPRTRSQLERATKAGLILSPLLRDQWLYIGFDHKSRAAVCIWNESDRAFYYFDRDGEGNTMLGRLCHPDCVDDETAGVFIPLLKRLPR